MFKWYGFVGILIIVFSEFNFFFKIEPFASWYFPIIWFGYILAVDAIVFKLRGKSLISNNFGLFLGIAVISALFWWAFEFVNFSIQNWDYSGLEGVAKSGGAVAKSFFGTLSFATVLPAFFETYELIRTLHFFDKFKLKKSHNISHKFIFWMIFLGIICFFAPLVFPEFTFPLVWASFFLILDPINYLHGFPSIIRHLKDRRLVIPLSLLVAGIIMGFFWEFWNYWAIPKWTYNVPYVGFLKVFEMPILGYLGYFPFAFELYAMYYFVKSLFIKNERLLFS